VTVLADGCEPVEPLRGVVVAVTRSEAGPLATALTSAGAEVVHVPLIDTGPPRDGAPLATALAELGAFDWLVTTSVNGVRVVADALGSSRAGPRLAAVGPVTGSALAAAAGRAVDLVPTVSTAAALVSEFPDPPARVLVAQAERAAPTLVDGLRAAGHDVVAVTAYTTRSQPPTTADRGALAGADVVVFASGSAVEAWIDAGLDAGTSDGPLVVAIGPSTARVAAELGVRPHQVADRPDPEGVVVAVVRAVRARAELRRTTP